MCSYHAWRWDGEGDLASHVPPQDTELKRLKNNPKSKCNSFPVKEKNGLLWLWPSSGSDARNKGRGVETVDIPLPSWMGWSLSFVCCKLFRGGEVVTPLIDNFKVKYLILKLITCCKYPYHSLILIYIPQYSIHCNWSQQIKHMTHNTNFNPQLTHQYPNLQSYHQVNIYE